MDTSIILADSDAPMAAPDWAARLVGRMIDVTITAALPHSLRGEPVVADSASGVSPSDPARSPATTA